MKRTAASAALAALLGGGAFASAGPFDEDTTIEVARLPFGSGTPAAAGGGERAVHVADGLYHAPNHLPGFPTAATLWPQEVAVECGAEPGAETVNCSGYRIGSRIVRGEYIFFRPAMKPAVPAAPAAAPVAPAAPGPAPLTRKKPLG